MYMENFVNGLLALESQLKVNSFKNLNDIESLKQEMELISVILSTCLLLYYFYKNFFLEFEKNH